MLTPEQMRRIEPFFPLSHGVPRVDDRRVLSGILFVIRNGLRWRDAPAAYGPHKTIYNRFIRWSRLGVFNRILAELAAQGRTNREIADELFVTVKAVEWHLGNSYRKLDIRGRGALAQALSQLQ